MVRTLIGRDMYGVPKILIKSGSSDPLDPYTSDVVFDSDLSTVRLLHQGSAALSTHTTHIMAVDGRWTSGTLPFGETLGAPPIVLSGMSRPGDWIYARRGATPSASYFNFSFGPRVVTPSLGIITTSIAGGIATRGISQWYSYTATTTGVTFDSFCPMAGNSAVNYVVNYAILSVA